MGRRYRHRPIKVAAAKADPTQVINFISALVETQVGSDEEPSPLMQSLVNDMKADKDAVELAQDITLLGLDVMEAVAGAVKTGNPKSVLFRLMGILGQALPEIEADIQALKK